jgi:hypothetical protein
VGCVGDDHKSLLTNGKNPFLQNNQTQTNPQIVKHTPHNHGPVQGGAHDPNNLGSPSGFQPGHPSIRTSASLEAALSSRPPRPLPPPHQSTKRSNTTRGPGSKANPRHTSPLTPPENHILALFHQPSLSGHPCQLYDTVR